MIIIIINIMTMIMIRVCDDIGDNDDNDHENPDNSHSGYSVLC